MATAGWARDRRDSFLYPTSGVYQRASLEVATPVLDMANARLLFTNLRYTVTTANMLTRSASWLLQPVVLQQLRRRAVFDLPGGRAGLVAAAKAAPHCPSSALS